MIDFTQFPDYEFTKEGQVISHRKNTRVLRPGYLRGYQHLPLYDINGKQHTFQVHRLILEYFCPNPDSDNLDVDHINKIRDDNRLENLRWLPHDINVDLSSKAKCPVIQYDLEGNFIKEWDYINQAANELGIRAGGICACCLYRSKRAGNYIWEYKDLEKRKQAQEKALKRKKIKKEK